MDRPTGWMYFTVVQRYEQFKVLRLINDTLDRSARRQQIEQSLTWMHLRLAIAVQRTNGKEHNSLQIAVQVFMYVVDLMESDGSDLYPKSSTTHDTIDVWLILTSISVSMNYIRQNLMSEFGRMHILLMVAFSQRAPVFTVLIWPFVADPIVKFPTAHVCLQVVVDGGWTSNLAFDEERARHLPMCPMTHQRVVYSDLRLRNVITFRSILLQLVTLYRLII